MCTNTDRQRDNRHANQESLTVHGLVITIQLNTSSVTRKTLFDYLGEEHTKEASFSPSEVSKYTIGYGSLSQNSQITGQCARDWASGRV